MSFTQGTLSSAFRVEIASFLLCDLVLVKQNSTWIMVATQQPDFAAVFSVQSMFLVNKAVAYLAKDKVVPDTFVTDLRADVSHCDSVAPINWDTACDDLEEGFPVDCTGLRYIEQEEQEEEDPAPDEEEGDPRSPPPPRHLVPHGGGGGGGTTAKSKNQSPVLMLLPRSPPHQPTARPTANMAMSTFATDFSPSQQT